MSTNLREVILGLLLDRPNHAYALKQLLAPRVASDGQINDGVLYPLLAKLEGEGLIEGRTEIGPSNRKRTIFTVTAAGKKAFMAWLATGADEAEEPAYDFFLGRPFLVKMQFFTRLSPKARAEKLKTQLARTEAKLRLYAEIRDGMVERRADPFRIALLDLGIEQQKLTRRWLRTQAKAKEG